MTKSHSVLLLFIAFPLLEDSGVQIQLHRSIRFPAHRAPNSGKQSVPKNGTCEFQR